MNSVNSVVTKSVFGRTNIIVLSSVVLCAAVLLSSAWSAMPPLSNDEWQHVRLPRDMTQLQSLYGVLSTYSTTHFARVYWAYIALYVCLQTFSIPGSIFLSFLGGALFGVPLGVLTVCFASATGASGAYLISKYALKALIERNLRERVRQFSEQVERRRSQLFFYIFALRVTPLLPNWFINLCSPIVDVPLSTFWLGSFAGVAAPTFFFVRAGLLMESIKQPSDVMTWSVFFTLIGLGLVSIVPTLPRFQRWLIGGGG